MLFVTRLLAFWRNAILEAEWISKDANGGSVINFFSFQLDNLLWAHRELHLKYEYFKIEDYVFILIFDFHLSEEWMGSFNRDADIQTHLAEYLFAKGGYWVSLNWRMICY